MVEPAKGSGVSTVDPDTVIAPRLTGALVNEVASWTDSRRPQRFHRLLEGYAPTPLVEAPAVARALGIGQLWLKDESLRLGLPSFKVLGAAWATARAVATRCQVDVDVVESLDDFVQALGPTESLTLTTATDGNHGRAVARIAKLLGLKAVIFVPDGTAPSRVAAIVGEGADVVMSRTYDDAVADAARRAADDCLVIADTSFDPTDIVPRWIVEGYSTLFFEIDDALALGAQPSPDVVVVPVGVGSLAAAAVLHAAGWGAKVIGVEPTSAACVFGSLRSRAPRTIGPANESIMAGLNAGTPSLVAWPVVHAGLTACVTIDDDQVPAAMRTLAELGIEAGETGAAGLAGLTALMADGSAMAGEVRTAAGVGEAATVLVLMTEGATDPAFYQRVVGVAPRTGS